MERFGIAVVTVFASATLFVSGCASVLNKGGDTTCKEFNGQDQKKQESEVAAMLKKKKGEEPSNLEITATRVSVEAFCKTLGKDSSKISEVTAGLP
jgi:acid stress chaperone HdeA